MITARDSHPYTLHPRWNQYEVLDRCLREQTYRDFELIAVTPFVEDAQAVLRHAGYPARAVSPRDTPWRRARTRCSASARNTGLVLARGDYTACIDDCLEFGSDYLERIHDFLQRGIGVATLSLDGEGKRIDGREQGLPEGFAVAIGPDIPQPQGIVAFPTEVGLDINGWDEHFDGGYGLEDVDFGLRLQRSGMVFALDRHIAVRLHAAQSLSVAVVAEDHIPTDPGRSTVRCCNSAYVLARESGRLRANEWIYGHEEIERRLCCFMLHETRCGYWSDGIECPYLHFSRNGHPVARRIMVDERYPETVNLQAERGNHQ